jgi:hypothetical protein
VIFCIQFTVPTIICYYKCWQQVSFSECAVTDWCCLYKSQRILSHFRSVRVKHFTSMAWLSVRHRENLSMFWDVSKRKNSNGNQEEVLYFIWQLSVPIPMVCIMKYNRIPLIRKLVIRNTSYPDRFGPAGKFVENSTKVSCLEITGYRIKYSAMLLWLLELQIRLGWKA